MNQNKPCLKDDFFYDYMTGSFSLGQQKKITNHLSTCKTCYQSYKMASEFLQDDDGKDFQKASTEEADQFMKKMTLRAEKSNNNTLLKKLNQSLMNVGKKIQNIIEDSILWITAPRAELSYVPVRSGNNSENVSYILHTKNFDNIQSEIYVQQINNESFCLDFKLLNKDILEKGYIRIILRNIDDDHEISKVLSQNHISFDDLCFGKYELIIKHNTSYKDAFLFEINQEGLHER